MTFSYNENSFNNDILRLLDANINRAREGIRVVEETSRMLFDDSELTKRIKNIRHSLIEICKTEKGLDSLMIFSRGSEKDVLRNGETKSEKSRPDLNSIVRANAARAQEAVRALEEFTKLSMPHLSGKFKELRFNLYDIEKALVSSIRIKEVTSDGRLKFCVVIDTPELQNNADLKKTASITKEVLDAGAGTLIFRDRTSEDIDFMKNADEMFAVCNGRDVTVLIENRLDIAMISHADGIIIEPHDISAGSCRKISGQSFAIGISVAVENSAPEKIDPNADFYVMGPVPEKDKTGMDKLETVREFVSISKVPVLISGNFSGDEIAVFFDCGAKGVIITPDYAHTENIFQELRNYREIIDSCMATI